MRRLKSLLCVFPLLFFAWGCKNDAADGDFELSKTKTLATPKNFTAVYDPVNNVTNFTWEEVPSATGYSVMESVNGKISDAVKIIPAATGTSGTVIGYSAKIQSFSYWLIAYNDSEESEITECRQIVTSAPKLAISAASCNESGVVSLEWTAAEGVSGYRVSYKNTGGGISEWTEFNQTLSANVDAGETYSAAVTLAAYAPSIDYRVRAVKGSASDETEWSEPKTVQINLFPPRNIGAESTGTYGEAKIVWDKIDGVTYNVYKSLGTDGEKTLLSSEIGNPASGNPNFTAQDLTKGTWYFWVESCVDGNKKCSTEGAAYTVKIPAPKNIRITERTETSLTVSWDEVADAAKYKVSEISGLFDSVDSTTTSATITGLTSGRSYALNIQGIESDNTEGEISTKEAKTKVSPITLNDSSTNFYSSYAYIAWNQVAGATSYELGYSETDNVSTATIITGITDTYYKIENLTLDKTYYYWVRPIDSFDESDMRYSDWVGGSGITVLRVKNVNLTYSNSKWLLSWQMDGDTSKFKILYCTDKDKTSETTLDTSKAKTVSDTVSPSLSQYDVTSIINDRDDGALSYYFAVEAYKDGNWYRGTTTDGASYWIGDGYPYGEKSQLPSGATSVSPRTTSYSNYGYSSYYKYVNQSTSTSTLTYFSFKAKKGKKYTVYYADQYSNKEAYLYSSSSKKADMYFRCYSAGSNEGSLADSGTYTFTCQYDAYYVVECKKFNSSTYGYYGIQVVESN